MNKRQQVKVNMRKQVKQIVNSTSPLITADIPMFMVLFAMVNTIMDNFALFLAKQEANRSGLQVNKLAIRLSLTITIEAVAAKLQSYARSINDLVIYNDMAYPKYKLDRLSSTELVAAATLIKNCANLNIANLAAYEIDVFTIEDINNLILSFDAADPLPEAGIQERQAATIALQTALDESNVHLLDMDVAVRGFKLKYPTFFLDYFRARKLVPLPTHVNVAHGLITDEHGVPMPFVHITCETLGIKRKATKKGRFIIRKGDEGIHIITYHFPGYETVHQEVTIYPGLRADILVTMHLHLVPVQA